MCHVSSKIGEAYLKAAHHSWPLMVPTSVALFHFTGIPYILESNPHPFYSFFRRGLKNQMWIRIVVMSWILEK
jgi:hypothetical protein